MRDREAAGVELGEQRLHVAQDRFAGGGIAHVADRRRARQALDRRGAGEMVADQAQATLGMESRAVEGDDARRLLAAMLQRVQPQRGDRGGVGVPENPEDAAFLVQPVVVEFERSGLGRDVLAGVGRATRVLTWTGEAGRSAAVASAFRSCRAWARPPAPPAPASARPC